MINNNWASLMACLLFGREIQLKLLGKAYKFNQTCLCVVVVACNSLINWYNGYHHRGLVEREETGILNFFPPFLFSRSLFLFFGNRKTHEAIHHVCNFFSLILRASDRTFNNEKFPSLRVALENSLVHSLMCNFFIGQSTSLTLPWIYSFLIKFNKNL